MLKLCIIGGLLACVGMGCYQRQPVPAGLPAKKSLPYYVTADFTPHWSTESGFDKSKLHHIPFFSFTNQDGQTINSDSVKGKIYVADFFFTSCRGICPKLSANLKMVQDSFINDRDVVLLSHSVTPDVDNVPTLKRYAENHGVASGKWHLLTGRKDSIYNLARKSYFADEDMGLQRSTDDFLHTENMLLIDKQGRIRGLYKGTSPLEMQNIVSDIRILKQEQ